MVSSNPEGPNEPTGGLSIGDLAQRTGVPAATLRSWEARYGAPQPERLGRGHRRYDERQVTMVQEVLRQRTSGLSLPSAIARAAAGADRPAVSVFASLRRQHPELVAHLLRKTTMLALSRAIEDECCAKAERPVLLGSFQHLRFYQASEPRWKELARTAEIAVVLADFPTRPTRPARDSLPLKVSLPAESPALREWTLICDAADYPVCLTGWEHPPGDGAPRRRFEAVWSVDPQVVRHAAQAFAQICLVSAPQLATPLVQRLQPPTPACSQDLGRAAGLLNRMIGYLEPQTDGNLLLQHNQCSPRQSV